MNEKRDKPLGHKSYGSIAHLPGSRVGPADKTVHVGQYEICCVKARDKNDTIIVQEKIDGSNCSVAKINSAIVPLGRAGYTAQSSPFKMHHMFHEWAMAREALFDALLENGERIVGEWMAQVHGTVYRALPGLFIPFDIMRDHTRACYAEASHRCHEVNLPFINTVSVGGPVSIEGAMSLLGSGEYLAEGGPEGAVWRVERTKNGKTSVDFLAKFVRQDKVDGAYLPEITGGDPVWHGCTKSQ